jgi:uncharacterized phage-associated protein
MPYKPSHVANSFLYRAKCDGVSDVTPLKIQKLTYFLHGWFLATRNAPVVGEQFEAWPYGPVLPSLYQEFKKNGSKPIDGYAIDIDPNTGDNKPLMVALTDKTFFDVFDRVWAKYKPFSGIHLSTLTHAVNTPWDRARKNGQTYLSDVEIKEYFVNTANRELA